MLPKTQKTPSKLHMGSTHNQSDPNSSAGVHDPEPKLLDNELQPDLIRMPKINRKKLNTAYQRSKHRRHPHERKSIGNFLLTPNF